jgi:hypothetical protein
MLGQAGRLVGQQLGHLVCQPGFIIVRSIAETAAGLLGSLNEGWAENEVQVLLGLRTAGGMSFLRLSIMDFFFFFFFFSFEFRFQFQFQFKS